MPKRGRPPDRIDGLVARLSLLRETQPDKALAVAAEMIDAERAHRALEPAIALVAGAAYSPARQPLRRRFDDLTETGDRYDQDCALRVEIIRALRQIDSRSDTDVAEAAIRTVQIRMGVDVAQALRAEGLLLVAESDPDRADYFAGELLHDPHTSTFSGEPAVTAIRVLAQRGHRIAIWAAARRPGLPPDVLAQAFASLRGIPIDLQLAALREHLETALAAGEVGDAVALVAAEAIVLNGLSDGYPVVVDLLRSTPNVNLYRYLALTMARAADPALREQLVALRRGERDEKKQAVLTELLGR